MKLNHVLLISFLGLGTAGCQQFKPGAFDTSASDPVVSTATDSTSSLTSSNTSTADAAKDEQTALDQIAKMTQAQCRDSMQQLNQFYQATRSLTDQQRKDYFEQLVQEAKSRGQEPPPPPPTMGGRVFLALQACAKGSQ